MSLSDVREGLMGGGGEGNRRPTALSKSETLLDFGFARTVCLEPENVSRKKGKRKIYLNLNLNSSKKGPEFKPVWIHR